MLWIELEPPACSAYTQFRSYFSYFPQESPSCFLCPGCPSPSSVLVFPSLHSLTLAISWFWETSLSPSSELVSFCRSHVHFPTNQIMYVFPCVCWPSACLLWEVPVQILWLLQGNSELKAPNRQGREDTEKTQRSLACAANQLPNTWPVPWFHESFTYL